VVSFILIGILMVMSTRAFMVTVSSVDAHCHELIPRRTPRPPPLPPPHGHHQYFHHHHIYAHHQVRSVWQSRRSSTGIGGMLSIHGGIMAPLTTQLMGMVSLFIHAPSAKPPCPRSLNRLPPTPQYLLSSLLLLRANVPCEYRHSVSVLLGEVEVGFYYQWFDTAFIVSAVAGAAVKIAGLAGVSDSGVDVNDLT
jgi:hypothetical protein